MQQAILDAAIAQAKNFVALAEALNAERVRDKISGVTYVSSCDLRAAVLRSSLDLSKTMSALRGSKNYVFRALEQNPADR